MSEDKRNNVGRNVVYQTSYQIIAVITPLITAPYISRVLGAEGLGAFSLVWTNALYFTLFAMLGVATYGVRSIANVQNVKSKRSIIFWNIYSIQAFMTCFMLVSYIVFVNFFTKGNKLPAITQTLIILGCLFDVNWYFFGVEKFKIIVTRNILIKILTVISVLLFVNRNTGVMGYCIVMGFGTLLSNAVLVPFLKNEIQFVKPTWNEIIRHIKPNFVLFIPVLASSVFHIMDKTMLGNIAGNTQLGYYMNADKVINIPIGLIIGLGAVFMPRITAMRNEVDESYIKSELYKSLELHSFVIFALSFGLAAISMEFAPLFFGSGFDPCAMLIIAFAPAFVVKSYSNYFRTNILIPFNREKQYTIAVIVGAMINFITNILLISRFQALGAVIGTVMAEVAVFGIQLYRLPIQFSFKQVTHNTLPYFLFGSVMLVIIRLISRLSYELFVTVALEVIVGGLTYLLCCILFWGKTGKSNIIKELRK